MSVILRMSYGSELQAVGPVTENARSSSLVLVGGTVGLYVRLPVDERIVRVVEMRKRFHLSYRIVLYHIRNLQCVRY